MDLSQVMQQAQAFQRRLADTQAQLAGRRMTASVGGGMVTVTVNGKLEVLSIQIEREIVNPEDPTMLQDLIVAGVNEALRKARAVMEEEMRKASGGLSIPGLSGLFG